MILKKRKKLKALLLLLLLISTAILWIFTPLKDYMRAAEIEKLVQQVPNTFSTFIIFQLIFFIGSALFIPVAILALATSFVFDFWIGLLCTIMGVFFASLSGYFVGRFFDINYLLTRKTHRNHWMVEKLQDQSGWAVFILRIAPTPPFTFTSLLSGSLKIPLVPYCTATLIGVLPLTILIQLFGRQIITLIKNPTIIAGSGLLALMALALILKISKTQMTKSASTKLEGQ